MSEVTFDLDRKSGKYAGVGTKNIHVSPLTPGMKLEKYEAYKHFEGSPIKAKNLKFNIKYKTYSVISVDTTGLVDGKKECEVERLMVYFRKGDDIEPIVVGIKLKKDDITTSGNVVKYYFFRELLYISGTVVLKNIGDIPVLSTSKPREQSEVSESELDSKYRVLKTSLEIDVVSGKSVYRNVGSQGSGETESDDEGSASQSLEKTSLTTKYTKYCYKIGDKKFNSLEIKCTKNGSCDFKGFQGSDYNDINLQEVSMYYLSSDSDKKVPLLVELVGKTGKKFGKSNAETIGNTTSNNNKVYFKFTGTDDGDYGEDGEWDKDYQRVDSGSEADEGVEKILNSICTTTRIKEKLIRSGGSGNASVIVGVLCTIITIIIITILVYKNYEYLNNVFNNICDEFK